MAHSKLATVEGGRSPFTQVVVVGFFKKKIRKILMTGTCDDFQTCCYVFGFLIVYIGLSKM